jgi:hypothetical protein
LSIFGIKQNLIVSSDRPLSHEAERRLTFDAQLLKFRKGQPVVAKPRRSPHRFFAHKRMDPMMALVNAAASSPALSDKQSASSTKIVGPPDCEATVHVVSEGASQSIGFVEQLYDVLEEDNSCLQWMPDGQSFTIIDHKVSK